MRRKAKLLEKAIRNPRGLRFADLEALLACCGWSFEHQRGSHRIWRSPQGVRASLQPMKNGEAKGYQVKQFLKQYEKEQAENSE